MKYYLYILKSESANKHYIGISQNPDKRLEYHNTLEKGFTSRYRPWEIKFRKEYESKEEAMKAEKKLKSWKSKVMIQRVVSKEIEI